MARLPCLATGTPAAATTRDAAVEMLNVPLPSPPVPTRSIVPAGASTRTTRSRIAPAKPASSSVVSPRIRSATRSAASWAGVASPSMTEPIAARASSMVSVRPSTTAASAARTVSLIGRPRPGSARIDRQLGVGIGRFAEAPGRERPGDVVETAALPFAGEPQEVRQEMRSLRGEHRLGVELDALERQRHVSETHDHPVLLGQGGDPEDVREATPVDRQRVVARRHERRRQPAEESLAVVGHLGRLAMDERRRADDRAAEGDRHRLHPEADPEQRDRPIGRDLDRGDGDAGR